MNDKELLAVIGIIRASNNLIADLKNNIKNYDINTTEFSVMEYLYHKGEKTIQQIRDRILVASGSTTYIVDNLQKKGYVSKKNCQDDKRIFYVDITDEGKKLMDELFPLHKENTKKIFKNFSDTELVELVKLLKKIKTN